MLKMRFSSIVPVLAIAAAAAFAPSAVAGEPQPTQSTAEREMTGAARDLIEDALRSSHAAQIFDDLRRTLSSVYIPVVRDIIHGTMPGVPAPGPKAASAMAKVLTMLDYLRKAGDELDAALSEHRQAMISDAAAEIAKTARPEEIENARGAFNLPAVRKGLDAFYAMTRLATGFSYEDSRTFSAFSAWVSLQNLDFAALPAPRPDAVPSKQKIAKAQALVNEILSISHVDEMAADVKRFVREVYAETAPMSEEEREELRGRADQYEFLYNTQKSVTLAAAPPAIAAALSESQLEAIRVFVRSAAVIKASDVFRDAVKSVTAFTKNDILEARNAFEKLEKDASAIERSPEERDRAKAEWDALADKWTAILENGISPETRSGLEKSIEDLEDESSPI
jgi:hypothetical protein